MADGERKYTLDDLKRAVAEADRGARLEMKVDYIIQKLEDPDNGCSSCRKRIGSIEDDLTAYKTMGGIARVAGSVAWGVVGGIFVAVVAGVIIWLATGGR